MKTLLVTGGAGFIGSALVRQLIQQTNWRVVNVDKLTYAGNLESLADLIDHPRHLFRRTDICDRVFEPFVSTKDLGMGLGLSICKDIIQLHGGNVWVESKLDEGTTINFSLPKFPLMFLYQINNIL